MKFAQTCTNCPFYTLYVIAIFKKIVLQDLKLYTIYPIVAHAWPSARASKGILHKRSEEI